MTALKGVNLGGWLVLEKWMTPSLFAGTEAIDEYTYCHTMDAAARRRLRTHHRTFITEADFAWLAANGIQAVRLPLGFWVFEELVDRGAGEKYLATLPHVDKAFEWAAKYKLKLLPCLHGAPGSQNGNDHSGRAGLVRWPDDENVTRSLRWVELMAKRYGKHPALLGIELLNEPSPRLSKPLLTHYYKQGYALVRRLCGPQAWVVFSDSFHTVRWSGALHWPWYHQAYLDTHRYQCFDDGDKALEIAGHLAKTRRWARTMRWLGYHRRYIVGEWSAALDVQSLHGLDSAAASQAHAAYVQAQLVAYDSADAWFFWSYRTETSADGPAWSYRAAVEAGWFREAA